MNPEHRAPPQPVPTAGVAIIDYEGQILLGRRSDDRTWCLPGGRLKPGESSADGARQECLEGLGFEVELDGIIAVLSNPETQIRRYPDGRVIQLVGVVFRGSFGPHRGDGGGEITEVDWFSSDQLPATEIMSADLPAVRPIGHQNDNCRQTTQIIDIGAYRTSRRVLVIGTSCAAHVCGAQLRLSGG